MKFKELSFDTLPSTNTYLKENYKHLDHGTVVVAKHQTAGRGRMMRNWYDSDDLLLSILIKESLYPQAISKMALTSAASVFTVLKRYISNLQIKWPNDLVVCNRKITGILLESVITDLRLDCLIVGIGINVNTASFPESIATKSTSLFLETQKQFDINRLKEEILHEFSSFYTLYRKGCRIDLEICRKNSNLLGKTVLFNDFQNSAIGKVLDISESGNIIIETNGKIQEYNYGEVSLMDVYKS